MAENQTRSIILPDSDDIKEIIKNVQAASSKLNLFIRKLRWKDYDSLIRPERRAFITIITITIVIMHPVLHSLGASYSQ